MADEVRFRPDAPRTRVVANAPSHLIDMPELLAAMRAEISGKIMILFRHVYSFGYHKLTKTCQGCIDLILTGEVGSGAIKLDSRP